jgi:hypothetical protein
MPTVPKDSRRAPSIAQPSETDLWMALAQMEKLGRVPSFDERFAGETRSLPIDVQSKGRSVFGVGKNKAEPIPSNEKDVSPLIEKDFDASLGVSGGSR